MRAAPWCSYRCSWGSVLSRPAEARAMIALHDVSVRYPGARSSALDGVTFRVARGRVTAVAGPNGSGKSTLVRALLRRLPLESGEIIVDGDEIRTLTAQEIAQRVAVAVQREEPAFPMRVTEYVALGRYPRLGLWRSAAQPDHEAVGVALERAE